MDQKEYELLEHFYKILYENLANNKNLKNNSILLSFLKTTSSNIDKLLRISQININLLDIDSIKKLVSNNYIQNYNNYNSFVISTKGIWEIESNKNIINLNKLLEYLNNDFYKINMKDENLLDREKVILFTMILGRSFSINNGVNLNKSEKTTAKWQEILTISYNKLKEYDYIQQEKNEILTDSINSNIVSRLFRQNNSMPIKTRGIYNVTRKNIYYLDLYDNGLDESKLSYLFNKLFKQNLTANIINEISDLCNQISREYSIYLYDFENILFTKPEFDYVIKDALRNSMLTI